ncbi:MAG: hypothetical protein VW175_09670, partial [Alphaproteobacteria bacterium]
ITEHATGFCKLAAAKIIFSKELSLARQWAASGREGVFMTVVSSAMPLTIARMMAMKAPPTFARDSLCLALA